MDEEPPARIGLPPGVTPADRPVEPAPHRVERPAPPVFFPAPVVTPAAPAPERWMLVLPGLPPRPLTSTVLVGRNPGPHPGYPDAELVVLPDEGRSVSKTHAVITIDGDALSVRDLTSTNGTAVLRDGAALLARSEVQLRAGDRIEFGSYPVVVTRG